MYDKVLESYDGRRVVARLFKNLLYSVPAYIS